MKEALLDTCSIIRELEPHRRIASVLHGPAHWARVHRFGCELASRLELPAEQQICVEVFALAHDLAREDDGPGNRHALDGAVYLRSLIPGIFRGLSESQIRLVELAIKHHSDSMVADEAYFRGLLDRVGWEEDAVIATVGCCWDADRLDLLRLGWYPRPNLMSTPVWEDLVPLAERLHCRAIR